MAMFLVQLGLLAATSALPSVQRIHRNQVNVTANTSTMATRVDPQAPNSFRVELTTDIADAEPIILQVNRAWGECASFPIRIPPMAIDFWCVHAARV